MRLFLALMLISFNAMAIDWWDLEEDQNYKLTQSFQLSQLERSGSLLDFSKGDEVVFKYKVSIPGLNTIIYVFNYLQCPGPQMATDLQYISVQETSPVVKIGAQLEPVCELNLFIESRDVFTKSFFE